MEHQSGYMSYNKKLKQQGTAKKIKIYEYKY